MRCLIADLITEVPAAGGLASRCNDYLYLGDGEPDITIDETRYSTRRYHETVSPEMIAYMESGRQFCTWLLRFGGFYLHASAVVVDGRAYLFSGNSGVGKSTHTRLWLGEFPGSRIINDDKPALRRIDGVWYAYGTPWCGKDGINRNERAPVAGVCFLKQADHNAIRRLDSFEAMQRILSQTIYLVHKTSILDRLLGHLELFLKEVPIYELQNRPEPQAAHLSYNTMSRNQGEDNP